MKILSIGNSFSVDAHKWLHALAQANGVQLEAYNLYISGCSLEKHWSTVENDAQEHTLLINGVSQERKIGIAEALKMDTWDVITFQQASYHSGMPESYEPYLSNLVSLVQKEQKQAKLYFHQTWAYELDSAHKGFANYDCSQEKMHEAIVAASQIAAEKIGAKIIPVGTVIHRLRHEVPEFDYANGGISLCRDGHHMSKDYGRYAAAATWLRTLSGVQVQPVVLEDFDPVLLEKIVSVVNKI